MASGKISPRQKMINMMYLVLLALLALNVSKEILKAFHLMEVTFVQSNKNIDDKNRNIVASLGDAASTQNAAKPWYAKAQQVKAASDSFYAYIESVKDTVIAMAGGRKLPEEGQDKNALQELASPDQIEKHANYFMNEGHGVKVQQKINDARERFLSFLDDTTYQSQLRRQTSLRADNAAKKDANGKQQTWASIYLEHSPLAGVTAMMSRIQNDARNLESDVLNYLATKVGADKIKVDKLEAKIIAPSSYIMQGQTYEAEIVLMALNSQDKPKIVVNQESLEPENGKGVYRKTASGVGVNKVEGYIETFGPSGELQKYPFATEWVSFQPAATISATAMNVLYIGLDNPISVAVPGFRAEDVVPSITSGSLTKTQGTGNYICRVQRVQGSKTTISVRVKLPDGTTREMGKQEYKVREVPNPEPLYGTLPGGGHGKGALTNQTTLNASLGAGFAFDGVKFRVTKFSALLVPKTGAPKFMTVNGNSLAQVNGAVQGARAGDKLIIAEIEAVGPSGPKKLPSSLVIDIK